MSLIRVKAFHYEGKEMKTLDDNRIVDLYLSRDEAAISQTSEKYGSRLRNVAYGIVEDLHTAEECENDTYMEAWNSIPPPWAEELSVRVSGPYYPPYRIGLLQRAQPSEAQRIYQ